LLGSNDVYAYVGSVSGRDVATALGIVADDHVGVFNVAVAPDDRRRGYGAALSARTALDGLAAGARRALLMSSEMGLAVYQQLGFREIERWSYWVPPDASEA
jgi:predicted GNAT family acetyltransferase